MPSALAIFAHPDDIEFVAAGTLLLLKELGWDIHYINLCTGNGGSVQMDGPTTTQKRLEEGQEAARILGATYYPPICDDLELTYSVPHLRKVAAERHIDPERIGAVGMSAGAHLSMMLGFMDPQDGLEGTGGNADQPSKVQAVVSFVGPVNLQGDFPPPSVKSSNFFETGW